MSANHRSEAERHMADAYACTFAGDSAQLRDAAKLRAMLAIEARLGELVDIQRAKLARDVAGSSDEPEELWGKSDDLVRKGFGLLAEGGAE